MSGPRRTWVEKKCVPNARADRRYKPKAWERGRNIAERDIAETRAQKRLERELAQMKEANHV